MSRRTARMATRSSFTKLFRQHCCTLPIALVALSQYCAYGVELGASPTKVRTAQTKLVMQTQPPAGNEATATTAAPIAPTSPAPAAVATPAPIATTPTVAAPAPAVQSTITSAAPATANPVTITSPVVVAPATPIPATPNPITIQQQPPQQPSQLIGTGSGEGSSESSSNSDNTGPIRVPQLHVPNISVSDIGTKMLPEDMVVGRLPPKIALPYGPDRPNADMMNLKTWTAPVFCYQNLFFEDVMLERHGHERCWPLQPVISGARFFTSYAMMPYSAVLHPPLQDRYSTGHYRAGTAAPCLRQRSTYDKTALRMQLLTTGTTVLAFQP